MNKQSAQLLKKHFDTALESPDGIKKLKELILTLAMQGKLVKQDPKDQPASELLKEIQAEKERLIAEGKIKKQKELPPVKPGEVPYEVPKGWEWVRNEEIVTLLGDGIHGTPIFDDNSEFFFINGNNLNDGKIEIKENTKRVSENEYMKYKKNLNYRTVFVSINGTIGNVAFYNNEKVILGKSACYFNLCSDISKDFIKKVINSKYFLEYTFSEATGTTIKNVSLKTMREFLIPLPPLAEQKRIVAKIDELMALCDRLEKKLKAKSEKLLAVHTAAINRLMNAADKNDFDTSWQFITSHFDPLYSVKENVAELKKAILTLAMQGKLVKQDPKDQPASELLKEIQAEKERLIKEGKIKKQKELPPIKPEKVPYEIPEGWVWTRLGDMCLKVSDGFHHSAKKISQGIRYISATHINNGWIEWDSGLFVSEKEYNELLKKTDLKKGDILIVNRGAGCGDAAIININEKFCFQNAAIIGFTQNLLFGSYLLKYIHKSKGYFLEKFIQGGAQPMLSNKLLATHPFPIPPLAEQKRIVAKIDELMALCGRLENKIDQKTAKQTALFDAVLAAI